MKPHFSIRLYCCAIVIGGVVSGDVGHGIVVGSVVASDIGHGIVCGVVDDKSQDIGFQNDNENVASTLDINREN